jgi:HSP20 family molecular chaperone IbpA
MRDFDLWFDMIEENPETKTVPRYPLTDILVDQNTEEVVIRIALAGFNKENVEVEKNGNKLVITGETVGIDVEKYDIIRHHISERSFERIVALNDRYVDGDVTANFEDGLLTITVKPSENQKQFIVIN